MMCTSIFRLSFVLVWMSLVTSTQAEVIPLRAGPVTMQFDTELAFLRYLRIDEHEILRGVNAPIRDRFWGTVLPRVSNLMLDDRGDSFSLSFDALCKEREIDFLWHGTITGSSEGQIEFTFDGQARSDFLRNRIGFCVLHGPDAAGKPWILEHADGTKSTGRFPRYIAPHQPAKNLRAVAHELIPGVWAHVRFVGEVFEMEDQRNWTDASFKTYCIPLEIPFPVRVLRGTKITQKVQLRLEGEIEKLAGSSNPKQNVVLKLKQSRQTMPVPRIGLRVSSQTQTLTPDEVSRLRALNLDHLRVDLTPAMDAEAGAEKLRRATRQAQALGIDLHVALHLGEDPQMELQQLSSETVGLQTPIALWLLVSADQRTLELAKRHLASLGGGAKFGMGEDTNFTELNRSRPDASQIDVISFGINPQVHAVDNASIVETLPIQADVVLSAMQFAQGRPVAVTPITLRPQQVNLEPLPGELPSNVDARQASKFNAGWTIGSVKYLAEAGASILTYFETVGWQGVMESIEGSPEPSLFPSRPGQIFPVYLALQAIGEFSDGVLRPIESSDTLSVVALVLEKGHRRRILVTNLTDRDQSVDLHGLASDGRRYVLDEMSQPASWRFVGESQQTDGLHLTLSPFAVVRIDDDR